MKFLPRIKNFTSKAIVTASIVIVAVSGFSAINVKNAQALAIGGQDCDNNAVMYCGANDLNTINNKYNDGVSNPFYTKAKSKNSIQAVYGYFGISSGDISGMSDQNVREGQVSRDNATVTVGGKVVATNVWTAGRQPKAGSTTITPGGFTFYKRHPNVSFKDATENAYVVMKNGVFQFAILAACGNPVMGTPKKPAPTPTPKPKPHHNACVNNACVQVSGAGSNTCSSNASCQPVQHHYACVENACVKVTGAGYNTCTSNANCKPVQHHNACVNNACVQVLGTGYSTCTSNLNCMPKPTATCTPTPPQSYGSTKK